jgi:osmotically-inducible protein OsmY
LRNDAERLVRRLTGVRGVTNLIKVKPRPTPDELEKNIEDALVRNADTDAQRIEVEVHGSKEAERVAWSTPGVTPSKTASPSPCSGGQIQSVTCPAGR